MGARGVNGKACGTRILLSQMNPWPMESARKTKHSRTEKSTRIRLCSQCWLIGTMQMISRACKNSSSFLWHFWGRQLMNAAYDLPGGTGEYPVLPVAMKGPGWACFRARAASSFFAHVRDGSCSRRPARHTASGVEGQSLRAPAFEHGALVGRGAGCAVLRGSIHRGLRGAAADARVGGVRDGRLLVAARAGTHGLLQTA